MLFGNDRTQIRRLYLQAWEKMQSGAPMEPLERLIAETVQAHPEYHRILAKQDSVLDRDFLPEAGAPNPFLHMGMHIALREQVATDRPSGIADLRRKLVIKLGNEHQADHQMMECLGETLLNAQRGSSPPDELAYLRCLENLVERLGAQKP